MKYKLSGFTLVELIVVITIIGILSTVWFVSYSNYLTWARDSNRYSQLTKLSDSLQVYATNKSLPLPDDYIEITASWASNVIAYQWYVWSDVLETIDYTNGGRDPKDDSYYTYYLTKDRKSLQLMALMEEAGSVAGIPNLQMNKTFAVDYSDRFPKVYGRKLWVLTEADTNTPVQEVNSILSGSGYLDIVNTNDNFAVIYDNNITISWTGSTLIKLLSNIENSLYLYDKSLEAAYDMETFTSTWGLLDLSWNWNTWVCSTNLAISYNCKSRNELTFEDWNAIFSWSWYYIRLPSIISSLTNFTIITEFKYHTTWDNIAIIWNSFTSSPWDGYFYWVQNTNKLWAIIYDSSRSQHQLSWITQLKDNKVYTWTFSFNWTEAKLFLNWKIDAKKSLSWMSIRNAPTSIWLENSAYWPLDWSISKMLIYNKALSSDEIGFISSRLK